MPTLVEIATEHTTLDDSSIDHLSTLVSEWGMLADFCFADMLLFVRTPDGPGDSRWLVVDQVRPDTSQTLHIRDWVGTWVSDSDRPVLAQAFQTGTFNASADAALSAPCNCTTSRPTVLTTP